MPSASSVALVALLPPRVPVVVVAVALPEPRYVLLAQFKLVADPKLVCQVGGDLAVTEPLDREQESFILWSLRDRIAAFGLIAVLGCEPDVYVLTGTVALPVGHVERDARHVVRLADKLGDGAELPAQSPW